MADINLIKATTKNILYYLNDTFSFEITVLEDGVAINLSNSLLQMQIKKIINRADYIMQFTTTDNSIVVTGASGNILTFTTTFAFKAGTYYFDLEDMTNKETIWKGKLIITQDVTR